MRLQKHAEIPAQAVMILNDAKDSMARPCPYYSMTSAFTSKTERYDESYDERHDERYDER